MKFYISKLRQSGDTIVEVMIAIAIVSSVIVGAFIVTQRSTAAVRDGQEHAEMLQILQAQVEHVRSQALDQVSDTGGIFSTSAFCIDTSDATFPMKPAADRKCTINDRYKISGIYDPSTHVFTFTGTWDLVGGGSGKEVLTYRVYSGKPVTAAPSPATPGGPASPGGSDGDAFFDIEGLCGGLGQPPCGPVSPGGRYTWNLALNNKSSNDPSKVLGCSWNWGDGTVDTYPADSPKCLFGASSGTHSFPHTPTSPYPRSCGQDQYTIRLTVFISGAATNPKWESDIKLPFCG